MNANRYPIDFEALQKGSTITADELEGISGQLRGTDKYNLYVLGLIHKIRKFLAARNDYWTVKIDKACIKILADPEAAEYNPAEYERARTRMFTAHFLNTAVDADKLNEEESAKHQRRLCQHGFELANMKKSRKEILCDLRQNAIENKK